MTATMLLRLVRQDFTDRFAGAALGSVWLLIAPLMQILVFTLVFGKLIGPRIPGTDSVYAYGLYLVSGILPWGAFANTIGRMSGVFLDKRDILTKVPVGLPAVALHIAIAEAVTLVAVLGLFMVLMVFMFDTLPATAVWVPLLLIFQQAMAFCLGLIAAILTVFLRDVKEFVGVALFLWFWMTPIVYLVDDVPQVMQVVQPFNPGFWFIEQYHKVLVYQQAPDLVPILLKLAGVLALSWAFLRLLARWERDIRDFI